MIFLNKLPHPLAAVVTLSDAIEDIGAVETVDEAGRALQLQLCLDFTEGAPVCGRGECNARYLREMFMKLL